MAAQRLLSAVLFVSIAGVAPGAAQESQSDANARILEATRRDCEEKKIWSQCYSLGNSYLDGWSVPQSDARAAELFRSACDGGYMRACAQLGSMFASGSGGVPQDAAQAVEFYRRACDNQDPYGCGNLGAAYASGLGVPRSEQQAIELFRRACAGGESVGCGSLATRDKQGRLMARRDLSVPVEVSQRACENGENAVCIALGTDYIHGRGVPTSGTRARALFRRACDNGDLEGCSNVGEKAKACAGRYLPACRELGMSEFWNGIKRQGVLMLGRACEAGDLGGCADLGYLYMSGAAMGANVRLDVSAQELFRRSCDGGNGSGCYYLAMAHAGGLAGVKRDEKRSAEFYRRACDLGNAKSCKRVLDTLPVKP